MRNTVIVVIAVAVLAAGFVLAQAGGDDGESTSAGGTTTQATVAPANTVEAPAASTATAAPEPTPPPEPEVPVVEFANGKPKGGVQQLEFEKGEQVRFKVRSDVDDEIHVHGFDEYADVKAGGSVTIAFKARFDGIYEVEMHDTGTQVAALEIQP
ncbi:MAG: hypothetical protein JWO90_101 [Solirubrobacterales bacterium]|jgi:hypothetical protein|nr:hypothetical protein [Solirubrobacterales bacterium]